MEDVFVGRIMSPDVHTAAPADSLERAAQRMHQEGISSVVVVDDEGHLEGILTDSDFVGLVASGHVDTETPVAEVMSTDVVTTTANAGIRDVASTMIDEGIHHVPVVDDVEGVVGMVTTTDLTAHLSNFAPRSDV